MDLPWELAPVTGHSCTVSPLSTMLKKKKKKNYLIIRGYCTHLKARLLRKEAGTSVLSFGFFSFPQTSFSFP